MQQPTAGVVVVDTVVVDVDLSLVVPEELVVEDVVVVTTVIKVRLNPENS